MGVRTQDWSTALSEAVGGGVTPDAAARTIIDDLAAEYRNHLPVIEGAVPSVKRLAKEFTLGLVSGSPASLIHLILQLLDLPACFQVAMSADDVARGKPAPDPYLHLASRLDLPPVACVAVEDSANGIRSARSAGMAVIAIPRGEHRPSESVLKLASAVLDDISQLTPRAVHQIAA